MEVREYEFARRFVNGVARADGCVVGFTDGPPVPSVAVEGNDMVVIASCRLEIHEEGLLPIDPERRRGDECAFDAVGFLMLQGHTRGAVRLAVFFEVYRQTSKEMKDFRWTSKSFEECELLFGQSKAVLHRGIVPSPLPPAP